jgi:nitroreductase
VASDAQPLGEPLAGDLFATIAARRSVRAFSDAPVPEADLRRILDAARMAPTSGNQQPWLFLAVRDPERIAALREACIAWRLEYYRGQHPQAGEAQEAAERERYTTYFTNLLAAPVLVVVLTDNESRWPSYNQHDGPLAAGTLMLAARALGYGTVYITDSIPEEVTREVFQIPARYTRVCATPIGVPQAWPATPPKRSLDELIVWDSF